MAQNADRLLGREKRDAARVARGERLLRSARPGRARRFLGTATLLACAAVFLALTALVALAGGAPLGVDRAAWQLAQGAGAAAPGTVRMWRAVSVAGSGAFLASAAGAVALGGALLRSAPTTRLGVARLGNVALVEVVNRLLKAVVARPRPAWGLVAEAGLSFPSGHAMNVVAFFGFLLWGMWLMGMRPLPRRAPGVTGAGLGAQAPREALARAAGAGSRTGRAALAAVALAACAAVCLARVCLGVHYLSDVVAGICAGVLWLALYVRAVGLWVASGKLRRSGR